MRRATTVTAAMAGIGLLAGMPPAQGSEARRLVIRGEGAPHGVVTRVVLPTAWHPGEPAILMVFLHDGRGDERSFERHGLARLTLAYERAGIVPPVLVASPRIRGTFVSDSPRVRIETFLARDLVPALERAFPGVGGSPDSRVVWGISMGGYGALKLALRHPGAFGRAAALAPWVQHLSWQGYAARRGILGRWLIEPVFGHSRDTSRFENNDLYRIAASADPGGVPPLLIRTGSHDRWEPGALELLTVLRQRGIAVDAMSVAGAHHGWRDWMRTIPDVLRWLLRSPR